MTKEQEILEIYQKLSRSTSERKKRSLKAIYEVCSTRVKASNFNFKYAEIAREGRSIGVPAAQSISNATGLDYRELIDAFSTRYSDQSNELKKSSRNWIQSIEDPALRLRVLMLQRDKRELETIVKEFIPPDQVIEVRDVQSEGVVSVKLNNLEREALEYLMSDEFLKKWEFEVKNNGRVLDRQGNCVFPIATIDALSKALKYL